MSRASTLQQRRSVGASAFGWRVGNYAATALFGLLLLGFLIFTYPTGTIGMGTASPVYQFSVLIVWAIALVGARVWVRPAALLLPLSLLLTLGWCWLSISWSEVPATALRRVAQATIFASIAFLIVGTIGKDRTLRVWTIASILTLVLSYLLIFLVPQIGIQQTAVRTEAGVDATWRGAFLDKNTAGAFCAMFLLTLVFEAAWLGRIARVVMIVACALFLLKSGSKTSIGIVAIAIAAGYVVAKGRGAARPLLLPLALLLMVVLALGWPFLWAPFDDAIFHDRTAFTGRGEIWAGTVNYIRDHWLLGAGFGSFWSVGLASPVHQYSDAQWVRDTVYVGHNGYLDLFATVGIVGLLLALWSLFILPFARILRDRKLDDRSAGLFTSSLIFIAGNNITESTLLNGDALLNVMLMLYLAMLYIAPAHARTTSRVGSRNFSPRGRPVQA